MSEEEQIETYPVEPIYRVALSNWPNMLGIFFCYFIGIAVGYKWPGIVSQAAMSNLLSAMHDMEIEFAGKPLELAFTNFFNSSAILYMAFAFGIFMGLPSVYLILSEGIYRGAMASKDSAGWWGAMPTDPSGVLELLAACIVLSWGMKLGTALIGDYKIARMKGAFLDGNRVFLRIGLIIIVLSAILNAIGL